MSAQGGTPFTTVQDFIRLWNRTYDAVPGESQFRFANMGRIQEQDFFLNRTRVHTLDCSEKWDGTVQAFGFFEVDDGALYMLLTDMIVPSESAAFSSISAPYDTLWVRGFRHEFPQSTEKYDCWERLSLMFLDPLSTALDEAPPKLRKEYTALIKAMCSPGFWK